MPKRKTCSSQNDHLAKKQKHDDVINDNSLYDDDIQFVIDTCWHVGSIIVKYLPNLCVRHKNEITLEWYNDLNNVLNPKTIEQIHVHRFLDIDRSDIFQSFPMLVDLTGVTPIITTTSMYGMFEGLTAFNGDLSNWNTGAVTDMCWMFDGATSVNCELSDWNTVNVKDMFGMFCGATAFNGDLSKWNTANVTNMRWMFFDATVFNGDLSTWKTGAVTNMWNMFKGARAFNGELSKWNTANVRNMRCMFDGATSFNSNLSGWNTANVTNMSFMFQNTTSFNREFYPSGYV